MHFRLRSERTGD